MAGAQEQQAHRRGLLVGEVAVVDAGGELGQQVVPRLGELLVDLAGDILQQGAVGRARFLGCDVVAE
ncbi:hypothetical protein ACWDSL_01710 [Streptomyces sp. NPDC000941]